MKSNEALDRLRADVYIAQRFRRELEALAGEDFRATVLEARRVWMDENPCEDGHDHETPFDRFLYGYRDQTASSCSHTDSGRYIEVHTLEAAQPTLYATPAPAMLNGVEGLYEEVTSAVAYIRFDDEDAPDWDGQKVRVSLAQQPAAPSGCPRGLGDSCCCNPAECGQPAATSVEAVAEFIKSALGNYPVLKWRDGYIARIGDKFYTHPPAAEVRP